jgi:hypothetical protein
LAAANADNSPPSIVTLGEAGYLEDRQRPQHLLGHQSRCNSDLVNRGGASAR